MIPEFKYHPDPMSTGSIKASDRECECCGKVRGYTYASNLYCPDEIEIICPWCIADGSAAKKFEGMFCDDYPLRDAGIDESIVDEVTLRTPGFNSWQQEEWQVCCNDACEFHGDLSKAEMRKMELQEFRSLFHDEKLKSEFLDQFKSHYEPGGNPAIYKWKCRHCGGVKYNADFT